MKDKAADVPGFDVFLSHNSKDKPAVRGLAAILAERGIKVWFDEDQLIPGRPWQPLMEEGIKESATGAVLVGGDGIGPWEDEEMQGLLRQAVSQKKAVIPVLLPGAPDEPDLPLFLGNRTWVDMRKGFTEEKLAELIWGITGKKPDSKRARRPACDLEVAVTRLRHGAEKLVGREGELARLDAAWHDPKTHVVTIVAWGGVGKTALAVDWMARMAGDGWRGAERVFDWSFYSQGTSETTAASGDAFVAKGLEFFGDPEMARSAALPWDKGERLAKLAAERKTLLVLDGIEPLQYPPGAVGGKLKDPAIEALVKGLAQRNAGLCIVTTREQVTDLAPFRETTAPEWALEHLSEEAGAQLLFDSGVRRAGDAEIEADDQELKDAAGQVGGHALTLRLLGNYLRLAHEGDVRRRDIVKFEEADPEFKTGADDAEKPYGHAFKVMKAYEIWLGEAGEDGKRQLAVLYLLGLFDRPADGGCIAALRKKPVIKGLTGPLINLTEGQWNTTITRLSECGIVAVHRDESAVGGRESVLDAHPLVREYFGRRVREGRPKAWEEAHRRVYEHLTEGTEEQPDTLAGLQPLYQAVSHGCLAGMHQEAREKVYRDRILRGTDSATGFYSRKQLGAIGSDLAAVAWFFDRPWTTVSARLSEADQAWLLNEAAFSLRALGRLTEALEPMRAAVVMLVEDEDWERAAQGAGNLSEFELTLGRVGEAVEDAERSVEYVDRSGDAFWRMAVRTTLADALFQAGEEGKAAELFREAEQIQAERQAEYPLLYMLAGFRYCDLLLGPAERVAWQAIIKVKSQDKSHKSQVTRHKSQDASGSVGTGSGVESARAACRDVEQRASQTLELAKNAGLSLLTVALDHLSLGRAGLYEAILAEGEIGRSKGEIEEAVAGLRRAGTMDHLPRGLLSRALVRFVGGDRGGCGADLAEAWRIAERGSMRLFMADVLLHRGRLFRDKGAVAEAREVIESCGYHRRDGELADAEEGLKE